MAWKGFIERPLFGWGPENYIVLFPKFFDPCLFTKKCGGEIWFDRTHNIVLDTLATTGIAGLLAYLGMFGAMFFVLIKKYFKEKSISFWTFSIFTALFVGYFVQNLTVFDMIASLMMFILTVSFIGFLAAKDKPEKQKNKPIKPWVVITLLIIFLLTFFEFVIQPYRTGAFVIQSVINSNPNERIEYYKKTFASSLAGKYQIRDFFAQEAQKFVKDGLSNSIPRELAIKELDFITDELKKTREESPLDFRATLKLAQVYNTYALVDGSVLPEADKYGQEALELSPTNQQAFWTLAQTKVYMRDFETALDLAMQAIDLEPEWLNSYKVAVQIAQKADKYDKSEEIIQMAVKINPEWTTAFSEVIDAER
jgi:tetratricopeptide (TPR) repeat protein